MTRLKALNIHNKSQKNKRNIFFITAAIFLFSTSALAAENNNKHNQPQQLTTQSINQSEQSSTMLFPDPEDLFRIMIGNRYYLLDHSKLGYGVNSYLSSDDKQYILNIEIPGFDKEQVKILLQGEYLLVEAKKATDNTGKQSSKSVYQRMFLPSDADKANITSSLKNGILTITIPKLPTKTIEVKTIPVK